jgi:hypothetical protein
VKDFVRGRTRISSIRSSSSKASSSKGEQLKGKVYSPQSLSVSSAIAVP